jgi:hypothetical protein
METDEQTYLDLFSDVFFLFSLEGELNENLLKFLVDVVDAKLFELIRL